MWVQLIHNPHHWHGQVQVSASEINALTLLYYKTRKIIGVALVARMYKVES